ncbi:phosphatase PAP2/dual specificity phosphatase family protein [Phyllobacterium lublinensis]|uniref:phosphatase PAP2/dual specificity phosphatase family protein n=1 Tax=Phyllobacterium lublinensis TaxID=2875708 RepID=UPI001CCA5C08|nr:phosphatase PAP2/dual specificity phosphatase family protein [Phyllobacterium sp. 2063]MBZ9654588.1 serine/threonine protein phosphatase [Phyllobacterium sp. 2063]
MTASEVARAGKWRFDRAVAKRAILWLLVLAPLFYISYGTANWLALQRMNVPNITFGWEHAIPFIAWTIFPYWSINLFYGLSLFFNETTVEVDRLAKRYLAAQAIAVGVFILLPLRFIFEKPQTSGAPGFLFDVLGGFDRPFNQAPSLHIALLVIIWVHWRSRLSGPILWVWHLWCVLIGLSVLTTYQHHVIDIPTGALLGLFALWLFPAGAPSPLAGFRLTNDGKSRAIGYCYAAGSLTFLLIAAVGTRFSAAFLFFLWPSLALAIVAAGYFGAGVKVFQKAHDGTVSFASRWLLAPYRLGAVINSIVWTRRLAPSVLVCPGVYLGRLPRRLEQSSFATVIDLTSELAGSARTGTAWQSFPALDLLPVPRIDLEKAAEALENTRHEGPVLVCCALGFQRSAAVIACWLVRSGRANSAAEAIRLIEAKGRRIHLTQEMITFREEGNA